MVQAPAPTLYFARAEPAWQAPQLAGLRATLEAQGRTTEELPLLRLELQPQALAALDATLDARSNGLGPQAYLFSSLRAVEALTALDRLERLDHHAPLACVGARALAALRAQGFDGPALTASKAAALENAIINASPATLGSAQSGARPTQWHYFCAAEVSHDFAALTAALEAGEAPPLAWHRLYAAVPLSDDDPALAIKLQRLARQPEAALVLVYSRALARRLGQRAARLPEADAATNWRHRLPVLCLSEAIAVELRAWDFRSISVAQTPNEEGLAALLQARLPADLMPR